LHILDNIEDWGERIRELMSLINEKNLETEVIISEDKKVKLRELLPFTWDA
jgi:Na+/phosphate symporter